MTVRLLAVLALIAAAAVAQRPEVEGDTPSPPRLQGPVHEVDAFPGIVFAEYGETRLDFTLYRPRGKGPHPAVLVIPGGAWRMDFRWDDIARELAAEGVAAAAMITRKAPAHDWRAQMDDCRRALQFLRMHADRMGIDRDRIGVVGFSSGGHLAALLSTEGEHRDPTSEDPVARHSTRPVCTVTYCAPSDLVLRPAERVLGPDDQAKLLAEFLGVSEEDVADPQGAALDTARRASPTWQATEDDPPMLVVHGENDPIVPVSQGRLLAAAMERAHVPHQYIEIADGRHVDYIARFSKEMGAFKADRTHPEQDRVWKETRSFLESHLLSGAAPRFGYHPERDAKRLTAHRFDVKKNTDIVYVRRGEVEMKLDLYLPATRGPHPTMLVFHGGGWRMGRRDFGDAPVFARRLASQGIATASVSYRLAPEHIHPAQYEDCSAALRFLRGNAKTYGLDPTRLGAIGLSAGGHLSALLAFHDDSSRPPLRAAVSCSGVLTLENDGESLRGFQARLVHGFLGYDPARPETLEAAVERGRDASPTFHADERDPPLLIVHAKDDSIVPWWSVVKARKRFENVGVRHEVVLLDSGNHGLYLFSMYTASRADPPAYWAATEKFLSRWLLGRP